MYYSNMIKLTKTQYNTIHVYVLRNYKKTGICELCQEKRKTDWSNISGNYNRFDRNDWQELCRSCHMKYDVEKLGSMSFSERGRRGGRASNTGGFYNKPELARQIGKLGGRPKKT